MRTELVSTLLLGADSPFPPVYLSGWSMPERGATWSVGERSEVMLPAPPPAESYLVELTIAPCTKAETWPAQRLVVGVAGVEVGRVTLIASAVVAFMVPGRLLDGGAVLTLIQPDAARPCDISESKDDRRLAMSVRMIRLFSVVPTARTTLVAVPGGDEAALLGMCESIGDNCELGLVQRRAGIEPVSLLRFSGINIGLLVRGIDESFVHFADRPAISIAPDNGAIEYAIYVLRYGLHHHTFIKKSDITEADLLQKQWKRLQFLGRTFMQELALARRLFVVKRNRPLPLAEVLPLFAAMNRRGPCSLLWVCPADREHAAGTVETVIPGLLQGWIEDFGNYKDAKPLHHGQWVTLIRGALAG